MSFNAPMFRDAEGNLQNKRYVHSPVDVDHNGLRIQISENGRVKLTQVTKNADSGELELTTLDIPASAILKTERLLKDTRKVVLTPVEPAGKFAV